MPATASDDIERIVSRMQASDPTAVEDLAALYGPMIRECASRRLRNDADAEEVTQDVLLKVWRKIPQFRWESALSSWIYRITLNTLVSRLRTELRSDVLSHAVGFDSDDRGDAAPRRRVMRCRVADPRPGPDELLARKHIRQSIARALADRPPAQRRAVFLHHLHGFSLAETGALVGVRPDALRKALFLDRRLLRHRLGAGPAAARDLPQPKASRDEGESADLLASDA